MRTPKRHIVALIKITDYPEDVVKGDLFCNRLQYYREGELREISDKFEATAVSREWYKLIDNHLLPSPIFCMYSVEARKQDDISVLQLKDDRLKKFGRYAVVIKDVKEFIKRIETRLSEFSYEAIRYIDMRNPKGVDRYAIFNPIATKDKYFSYQQEFRIFSNIWALGSDSDFMIPHVKYINTLAKKFPMTDMKDIVQQFETDELFSGVNIEFNVDWDFCRKDKFQTKLPKLPH